MSNSCNPTNCSLPGCSAMGFSMQEYWSEWSFPLQGYFLTQELNPGLLLVSLLLESKLALWPALTSRKWQKWCYMSSRAWVPRCLMMSPRVLLECSPETTKKGNRLACQTVRGCGGEPRCPGWGRLTSPSQWSYWMIPATGMSPGEPGDVPVCTPGQEQNRKHINDCGFFNITFFFFLPYDIWNLSSPTRDQTCALCSGSLES